MHKLTVTGNVLLTTEVLATVLCSAILCFAAGVLITGLICICLSKCNKTATTQQKLTKPVESTPPPTLRLVHQLSKTLTEDEESDNYNYDEIDEFRDCYTLNRNNAYATKRS